MKINNSGIRSVELVILKHAALMVDLQKYLTLVQIGVQKTAIAQKQKPASISKTNKQKKPITRKS